MKIDASDLYSDSAPHRYYWVNPAAARWSKRTGRPLIEWLWNDDADTRRADEVVNTPPTSGGGKGDL